MSTLFPGAGDDGASWQAGAAAAPPAHARLEAGPRCALERSAEHQRNRRRLCRLRADLPRRPPGSRRGDSRRRGGRQVFTAQSGDRPSVPSVGPPARQFERFPRRKLLNREGREERTEGECEQGRK